MFWNRFGDVEVSKLVLWIIGILALVVILVIIATQLGSDGTLFGKLNESLSGLNPSS